MKPVRPTGKNRAFKVQTSPNVDKDRFYRFLFAIALNFFTQKSQNKQNKFFHGRLLKL